MLPLPTSKSGPFIPYTVHAWTCLESLLLKVESVEHLYMFCWQAAGLRCRKNTLSVAVDHLLTLLPPPVPGTWERRRERGGERKEKEGREGKMEGERLGGDEGRKRGWKWGGDRKRGGPGRGHELEQKYRVSHRTVGIAQTLSPPSHEVKCLVWVSSYSLSSN